MRHRALPGLLLVLAAGSAGAATFTVDARDANGAALSDVVVVLDPVGAEPKRSPRRATIDQVSKQFVPRVSVVQTGTVVDFPNSDRIRHQVYSFSEPKRFNLKLYAGTEAPPITFDTAGLVVLGCNIHDTMVGFVIVADTPYFAKSGANGIATIDVPPGRYRLRVWHANLASRIEPREIAVGAEAATQKLVLPTVAAPVELAEWPN